MSRPNEKAAGAGSTNGGVNRSVDSTSQWQSFPTHTLPSVWQAHLLPVAARMDTDPVGLILPALSIFASAIGNTAKIVVREQWNEPAAIWTGSIELPGSMKTQKQEAATVPVYELQRSADAEFQDQFDAYERDLAAWEAAKRESKGAPPENPKPVKPARRQVVMGDTTPEAAALVLSQNPRGLGLVFDELAAMFGSLGRYANNSNGAEPGAAFYKSAFNGKTFIENRKGVNGDGKYVRIESPLVSITGAIQPEALRRVLTRQYIEDGLASRFLWAMPPDRPGGWVDDADDNPVARVLYCQAYHRLAALPLNVDPVGKIHPMFIGLAGPAQLIARNWVNGLRDRIADAPSTPVRSAWAKLKGIVFRIALVIHLADWAGAGDTDEPGSVSVDTLNRAIVITNWFANEAVRVYDFLCKSDVEIEGAALVEWIEKRGGDVSVNDVRKSSRRYPTVADARSALLSLEQSGGGNLYWTDPGPTGGKPSQRFRLHGSAPDTTDGDHKNGGISNSNDGWGVIE